MENALDELNAKHSEALGTPKFYNETENIIAYAEANKDNSTVYILDIMTGDVQTGFKLGKHIKEINSENLIIYITDFKEKILSNMRHKMLSLGFILKDSDRFHMELEEGLLTAQDHFAGQFFVAEEYKYAVKVRFKDIYYFHKKKQTGYAYIIHKNGRTTIKDSLVNIIKKLNSDFCYSTKEYIVNKQAITRIDKEKKIIYFDNGHECPYSRTRKEELFK
jgi:two-component system response regulator AgrA